MELLRYGLAGQEKPGILASDGGIRDLSFAVSENRTRTSRPINGPSYKQRLPLRASL